MSNSIIFKIGWKHLWWNYLLVKDQKEFLDFTILSITLSRRLRFKKQLFQKSCRPTAYSCSFSKSKHLTNRKYWTMLWKGSVMQLLCSKLLAFKLQPSFLLVLMFWKIPNIAVKLLFTEAGTSRFSTE